MQESSDHYVIILNNNGYNIMEVIGITEDTSEGEASRYPISRVLANKPQGYNKFV